jgi:hypothetical protein
MQAVPGALSIETAEFLDHVKLHRADLACAAGKTFPISAAKYPWQRRLSGGDPLRQLSHARLSRGCPASIKKGSPKAAFSFPL